MTKLMNALLFLSYILIISGCVRNNTPTSLPEEFGVSPVSPPSTFDEALIYMQSQSVDERLLGMWAVLDYPDKSQIALPFIVQNLYYQQSPDVRSAAARVLGEFGQVAKVAVPDLIIVMPTDSSSNVQIDIVIALGKIDAPNAVPALADNLNSKDYNIAAFSAKSISQLTGETFPDSDSGGFRLDEQGVPLIVIAAREWWINEGQFENWSTK